MSKLEPYVALGLFADTSLIGVDVAVCVTDGIDIYENPLGFHRPYPYELREKIDLACKKDGILLENELVLLEREITDFHKGVIKEIFDNIESYNIKKIDVISFPGQLINLDISKKKVLTLGNAQEVANQFKCPVVTHFIQSDILAGGKGRPLFPLFIESFTKKMLRPLEFISLGGITSVVVIEPEGQLQAFDIACAQILMDLWMQQTQGELMDYGGSLASKGKTDFKVLKKLLSYPYLSQLPPKSLDRNFFDSLLLCMDNLTPEDGMATLVDFSVETILKARSFYHEAPKLTIFSGGGTYNPLLMRKLRDKIPNQVQTIQELGLDKNSIEALSYAFLAVRTLEKLPISLPETTGALQPVLGGTAFFSV